MRLRRPGTRLLSAVMIVMVVPVAAQTPNVDLMNADSTLWEKFTDWGKLGYVMGFGHGRLMLSVVFLGTSRACSDEVQKHVESFYESNPAPTAQYGQWVAGLDEFYKDWRNKRIPIFAAMRIVGLQLAGRPQAEIDEALRSSREGAAMR